MDESGLLKQLQLVKLLKKLPMEKKKPSRKKFFSPTLKRESPKKNPSIAAPFFFSLVGFFFLKTKKKNESRSMLAVAEAFDRGFVVGNNIGSCCLVVDIRGFPDTPMPWRWQ